MGILIRRVRWRGISHEAWRVGDGPSLVESPLLKKKIEREYGFKLCRHGVDLFILSLLFPHHTVLFKEPIP